MTSVASPGFCTNLSGYYPVHDYIPGLQTNIGIVLLVAGLLNVFMSLVTVFWIKRQSYLAQEETENADAVKSVIFPVFVRLLWLSVAVNTFSGILVILAPLHRAGQNTALTSALFAFVWAMQHGVLEGVAFLLMQKGCGQHAAKRVRFLSMWWISFVFVLMFCSFYYGSLVTAVLSSVRDAVLVMFYLILYFAPKEKLFRRPAALFYSKCWLLYRGFFLSAYILMIATDTEYLGNCGYILLSLFVFAIIQPLIMYATLLRDSWWWQGIEINQRASRNTENDIRLPLMGSEYSLQSAQALAGTVDDMRVRGNVTMLNFACIKLDSRKTLGAGSFSKVYKGTYRGKDCAIKLIYTMDITAETIKKVAAEASILSSIRNKNIVNILGVSVLPPSVCLILELCSFGSLSDIIRGYGFDWNATHRAPLKLSYPDILYLALGCARGLAAVHSYDSSLCHRDVKSFNFLVDHQFNVKIADLELGMMAGPGLSAYDVPGGDVDLSLPDDLADPQGLGPGYVAPIPLHSSVANASSSTTGNNADNGGSAGNKNKNSSEERESLLGSTRSSNASVGATVSGATRPKELLAPMRPSRDPECVNVNELLANWLAPEVILERKFQQASDVYALGTVLWEILSGLLPFDGEFPVNIRRKIVSGYTHTIPNQYINTRIGELITSCWSFDPKLRPTCKELAVTLEASLHDQCYKVIKSIDTIPDTTVLRSFYDQHYRKSVYGDSRLHKYLFADLSGPSFCQYINPINWIRYLYHVYSQPFEPPYRGLSVDDSSESGSFNGDSSLSDSGPSSDPGDASRILFEPDESSESGLTSRSSYVISDEHNSGNHAMYAQLPRAALDVIGVIKEEAYWESLEKSGAAWAVTTIDAPYIVMHATAAWYKLFNIRHSIGSYHHMYSIMSLIGRDTTVENADGATISTMNDINTTSYTSSNAYVHEWKECTPGSKNRSTHQNATNALLTEMHEGYRTNNYKKVHGVLCFSKANKRGEETPRGSFSTSQSAPQGHNLMCTLHIYPIFATPPAEKPAPAADETPVITRNALTALGSTTSDKTYRGLLSSSPMREFPSALSSNLASVNTNALSTPSPQPHETPTLRRSNTQMSHTSFASTIRSSMRQHEPDVPRPVYYAILFHELSEQTTETGGEPSSSASPASSGRATANPSPDSGGLTGTLQSLIPGSILNIGRYWSNEKNKEAREVSKHDYQQVVSSKSTTYKSGGGGTVSGGGSFSIPSSRDSKENRHSFS